MESNEGSRTGFFLRKNANPLLIPEDVLGPVGLFLLDKRTGRIILDVDLGEIKKLSVTEVHRIKPHV